MPAMRMMEERAERLKTEREETEASRLRTTSRSGDPLPEFLLGSLAPETEGHEGSPGQGEEKHLLLREFPHLTVFPVPAHPFIVAKGGLDPEALAIAQQEFIGGGKIADDDQGLIFPRGPQSDQTDVPPPGILEELPPHGAAPAAATESTSQESRDRSFYARGIAEPRARSGFEANDPVPAAASEAIKQGWDVIGTIGQDHHVQIGWEEGRRLAQQRLDGLPVGTGWLGDILLPGSPRQGERTPTIGQRQTQQVHTIVGRALVKDQHCPTRGGANRLPVKDRWECRGIAGAGLKTRISQGPAQATGNRLSGVCLRELKAEQFGGHRELDTTPSGQNATHQQGETRPSRFAQVWHSLTDPLEDVMKQWMVGWHGDTPLVGIPVLHHLPCQPFPFSLSPKLSAHERERGEGYPAATVLHPLPVLFCGMPGWQRGGR